VPRALPGTRQQAASVGDDLKSGSGAAPAADHPRPGSLNGLDRFCAPKYYQMPQRRANTLVACVTPHSCRGRWYSRGAGTPAAGTRAPLGRRPLGHGGPLGLENLLGHGGPLGRCGSLPSVAPPTRPQPLRPPATTCVLWVGIRAQTSLLPTGNRVAAQCRLGFLTSLTSDFICGHLARSHHCGRERGGRSVGFPATLPSVVPISSAQLTAAGMLTLARLPMRPRLP